MASLQANSYNRAKSDSPGLQSTDILHRGLWDRLRVLLRMDFPGYDGMDGYYMPNVAPMGYPGMTRNIGGHNSSNSYLLPFMGGSIWFGYSTDRYAFDDITSFAFPATGSTVHFLYNMIDGIGSSYEYVFVSNGVTSNNSLNIYIGERSLTDGLNGVIIVWYQDGSGNYYRIRTTAQPFYRNQGQWGGLWAAITFRHNADGTGNLFVNGVEGWTTEASSGTPGAVTPTNYVYMGDRSGSDRPCQGGYLGPVAHWDRPLSDAEIMEIGTNWYGWMSPPVQMFDPVFVAALAGSTGAAYYLREIARRR